MATPDEIPTNLTLETGDVSPDQFVTAVRNFFGYVSEITESQEGDGTKVNWTVRVSRGSNLIGLEPNADAPKSRIAMIYNKANFGVETLATGNVEASGLSDRALNHLKALSEMGDKAKAAHLRLWVNRQPRVIGREIARAIKESWESDYHDYGTVEGRLEAIKDASGSLKIGIRDYLFPKAITCDLPDDMIDTVFANFRRRVELTGMIHYRRDGVPMSIEASEIEALPEDDQLPSAADVRGILAST